LYWGYKIIINREKFNTLVSRLKKFHFLIATSKHGDDYSHLIKKGEKEKDDKRKNTIIVFGPRAEGLGRFFNTVNDMKEQFDMVVNLFPDSGTKSIRLEEAIPFGLSFYKLKKEYD
jgi:predicted SPOUT superfamily RNA methylase MTH1